MKHLFIINPVAGKGKPLKFIPDIKKIFSERDEEYVIELTECPGHATEIAKQYSNGENYRIYSVGGDGTLNEVLNGMVHSSNSLAVIPGGSGNDFVRNYFDIKDKSDILISTINGKEKLIDIGRANNKYFINISSIGLDAQVAYNADRLKNLPVISGSAAYIMAVIKTLLNYSGSSLKIEIDHQVIETKCLLVAVANGKYYGGGMMPTPEARIDDGMFDICIIEDMRKLKILKFFPSFMKGHHQGIKGISFYRGKKIHIYSNTDIALNIDGEVEKTRHAEFEIIPQCIRVVLPVNNHLTQTVK